MYNPFISRIIYVVMPVYIGEMSPKASRGSIMSLIGPGLAIGGIAGLSTNIGFSKFLLGWRVTSVVLGVGGLLYAFGALWVPHTPRFLFDYLWNMCDFFHTL